jgi:alpha-L-rhamnosidase
MFKDCKGLHMTSQTQTIIVFKPSLEHQLEPLGIGQATPRLSWIVQTDLQDWLQAAYEIEVSRADQTQTSGRIEVAQSVLQPWSFAPLQSREHVRLRVRVWGQDGSSSDWSEALEAEAGRLAGAVCRSHLG